MIDNGIVNPRISISDDLGRPPYGDWEYLLLLMWDLYIIQNIHDRIFGRGFREGMSLQGMLEKIYYSYYIRPPSTRITSKDILEYFIYGPNE